MEWVTRPHQPLPRPVAPVLDETLESYLWRLAAANHLDPSALRIYLAGSPRKAAPVPVPPLALLSGQDPRTLRYAILELNTAEERATLNLDHRPRPGGTSRKACQLCAVSRGARDKVWCWNHREDVICLRHRRWLGDGVCIDSSGHQPSLDEQPDILAAHRHHRNLIRRHGRARTAIAIHDASSICKKWHDRGEHLDDAKRLFRVFQRASQGARVPISAVHAACYPQVVALTALLVSPGWATKIEQSWPEPTAFIEAVRRTVAPDFWWSLTTHYGRLDPLVALILERIPADVWPPAPAHPFWEHTVAAGHLAPLS